MGGILFPFLNELHQLLSERWALNLIGVVVLGLQLPNDFANIQAPARSGKLESSLKGGLIRIHDYTLLRLRTRTPPPP